MIYSFTDNPIINNLMKNYVSHFHAVTRIFNTYQKSLTNIYMYIYWKQLPANPLQFNKIQKLKLSSSFRMTFQLVFINIKR